MYKRELDKGVLCGRRANNDGLQKHNDTRQRQLTHDDAARGAARVWSSKSQTWRHGNEWKKVNFAHLQNSARAKKTIPRTHG